MNAFLTAPACALPRARIFHPLLLILLLFIGGCGDDDPVMPRTPPTASFTVSPQLGTVDTDFAFDATGSSDTKDDAAALQVRWDWENDGVMDTGFSTTKTATHRFASVGQDTVVLEVLNTAGLTAITTRTVEVGDRLMCFATAIPISGETPLSVEFGAQAVGGIFPFDYTWSFGDGDSALTDSATHVYSNEGFFNAVLTITDASVPPGVCRDTVAISVFPPAPRRNTPEALLTSWFEQSYGTRDSILYSEMLHDDFQFVFLAQDAESLMEFLDGPDWWGPTSDRISTGNMFRAPIVTDIVLQILVNANLPYSGVDCPDCREMQTSVALRVDLDESVPRELRVDSPQTFVVTKDPSDSTQWVLYRQFDRQSGAKARFRGPVVRRAKPFVQPEVLFTLAAQAERPRHRHARREGGSSATRR
jgi:hypothetical protein